jgi:predicted nucleic acid-binding protein
VVYLDSSAIVKLVVTEPESGALRLYLASREERVASGLARVEVIRALRRVHGNARDLLRRADEVLGGIALVAVDDPVLRDAAALAPRGLRSLDAVHLATALSLDGIEAVVTYDRRLSAAAAEAGLDVAAPT